MGRKDKLGRLLLSILFAGILFKGMTVFASTATTYTFEQTKFLTEIKKETIEMVENQKKEAEKLRRCFGFPLLCPSEITAQLPLIRKAIRQKSEEYRLLVGLARSSITAEQGFPSVKLGLTTPKVALRTKAEEGNPSELYLVQELHKKDLAAINEKMKRTWKRPQATPGVFSMAPNISPESYYWGDELKTSDSFYEMQALMIANQLPFVMYLDSDRHSDGDIAKALGLYVQRVQEALNDLYNEEKNPAESFLVYEPVVREVLHKTPGYERVFKELLAMQKPKIGFKAWVSRNSPSLKLAALSTCSFVAALLQSWPVSLACGGAVATLTSIQLYDDYFRMREDFSLWLVGAQSRDALKSSEARIMYSAFSLLLSGQAVGTTLMSIETGLVATLSSIPTTAAARFTSLAALRDGSLRFASRTINFKGKDLGASLLAGNYAEMTDENLVTSRQDRIFTYSDFLRLNQKVEQTAK